MHSRLCNILSSSLSVVSSPSSYSCSKGSCVALDCEMVGAGLKGRISMLARVAVVNHHGHILLDSKVAPTKPVTDYRTRFSGIRKRDLIGGTVNSCRYIFGMEILLSPIFIFLKAVPIALESSMSFTDACLLCSH